MACIHEDNDISGVSGLRLREQICSYIRDNEDVVISISPDEQRTLSEAVGMEGYTCLSYCAKMRNVMEWGSVIEIATVAEMFLIGIRVYVPVSRKRYFTLLGTYRCLGFNSESREICLLYTGYNHYDSLVDWSNGSSNVESLRVDYSTSYLRRGIAEYNTAVSVSERKRVSRKRVLSASMEHLSDTALSSNSSQYMSRRLPNFIGLSVEAKRTNRKIRIEKRRAALPVRRSYRAVHPVRPTSCADDALLYAKNYDRQTRFIVCGICGLEGPSGGCKLISDMQHFIDSSGLKAKFTYLTTIHSYTSTYDRVFVDDLLRVFNDGLIIGCTHLCGCCCQQLKGKKKSAVVSKVVLEGSGDNISDGEQCHADSIESDDDSIASPNDIAASQSYIVPKFALFNGLFPGTIPLELVALTCVEESMINIYSSVTKMFLAGGKHYKVKGGTSYTIINDLTSVAKFLPRMPSIEDTAIMRHRKTVIGKEYKYRPFKVYSALNWLKKYNHLYADIEIVWPNDVQYWQNTTSPVDIPFIELTDDEVCDIDGDYFEDGEFSDEFTTNTGIY